MPERSIRTRFELEGEKQYKQAISEINSGVKVLDSEMRKLSATFEGETGSLDFLEREYDILNRKMLSQKDSVETLRQAVKDAGQAYKESDPRLQQWIIRLNDAEAALAKSLVGNSARFKRLLIMILSTLKPSTSRSFPRK